MMKPSRQSLTFSLMIASIALLLALQGFWLRVSYERAFFDLRKEANDVFRQTVFTLRDNFLLQHIEPVAAGADTVLQPGALFFSKRIDTLRAERLPAKKDEKGGSIQIFVSSTSARVDSIKAVVKPLAAQIHAGQMGGVSSFMLRFSSDSLSTDTLKTHFARALTSAGIEAPFSINHVRFTQPPIDVDPSLNNLMIRNPDLPPDADGGPFVFGNRLSTDWVRYDPLHRYSTTLTGIRPLLLREITPQILFSVFLTVLTCAAFYLMYRSMRAQQKLMELKNDFISNITHELKTPVTTVSVALEALRNFRGLENPKLTEEYLTIAQGELMRLSILTDKILKTAIFENKGVSFEPEPVDLDRLIGQILGSMKLLFEKHKAQVSFEKKGSHFVVHGGTLHLTNVIYNLLDNALKYSPDEPRIEVQLNDRENQIEIVVKDRGIGIPAEFRKKVFEKFFRVPTGDVHNIKGYGLGLSYVDSVVRSHQGKIEVESGDGPGSLFRITLPKQSLAS
jgi:signal transduction histidine kinase